MTNSDNKTKEQLATSYELNTISGVLITGGGGFLGSHLAEYFLRKNIPVVCVDDFCTGLRSNQTYLEELDVPEKKFQFIETNVTESWNSWTGNIKNKKISHIFHFASPASPPHYQRLSVETMWVNTKGLENAILYADQINARVIFASTSEIYGDPEFSPQKESYWGNVNTQGPRSCYDEAKRMGEAVLYSYNLKNKTNHGLVRIFNTYGPRMNPNDGRVIINFLVQALLGKDLTIYGSGSQTRSFCYVDDLVAAITRYAATNLTTPVNVGNETEFTILELAQLVEKIFAEKKLQLNFFDLPKDDPRQRRPDLTLAKQVLAPWQPKISLASGLEKMLEWLKTEDLAKIQMAGKPL